MIKDYKNNKQNYINVNQLEMLQGELSKNLLHRCGSGQIHRNYLKWSTHALGYTFDVTDSNALGTGHYIHFDQEIIKGDRALNDGDIIAASDKGWQAWAGLPGYYKYGINLKIRFSGIGAEDEAYIAQYPDCEITLYKNDVEDSIGFISAIGNENYQLANHDNYYRQIDNDYGAVIGGEGLIELDVNDKICYELNIEQRASDNPIYCTIIGDTYLYYKGKN